MLLANTALVFITIFTSTISGAIGMAGGILLLSAMTFFLSIDMIVPIHGMVQLASNSTRSLILRQHFNKNLIISFALGVPLGAIVSTYLITTIQDKRYFFLAIAIIIFFALLKPKKFKMEIPDKAFFVVGFCVGFLGLFVGATGPFIAPFFLGARFSKQEVVANKAILQVIGHFIKIPVFLSLGFNYQDHFLLIGTMIIASIIGTKIGTKLLSKINDKIFALFFKSALLVSAIRLLFKFFSY